MASGLIEKQAATAVQVNTQVVLHGGPVPPELQIMEKPALIAESPNVQNQA
jgi:hypothetical protein